MRDSDVRAALRHDLAVAHANDPETRIVEEMGVWSGAARVDLAVINGELAGYELKSNSDTLERLPAQAEIYGKLFDRMTLVVGDKHAEHALHVIPPWWGCIIATMRAEQVILEHYRASDLNPQQDPSVLVEMLWKDEALRVLEKHGLAKGWRSKRSADIAGRLLSEIPLPMLAEHVRAALKARARLGQLASSQLDVSVYAVTHPARRASG